LRVAFTILALLLVAILCVALAAPYFIDWTGQRRQIEAHLSRILGSQVSVAGPIDLKLLPVPYITLAKVHVADNDKSVASLDIDRARLELTLTALVHGQFRFTQASFDRPVLTTARNPVGSLSLPHFGATAPPEQVALDKIIVRDGRIEIAAAKDAPAVHIGGIDLDAEAESLRGPFKGAGAADGLADSRLSFRFATGVVGANDLAIKGAVDAEGSPTHSEFDGAVAFARPGADAVALSYSGTALLTGAVALGEEGAQWPWRASGAALADSHGVDLSNLEFRLGEDERALIATGSAKAEFGAKPALTLNLASKKLDLDAMLRRQGETSVPPARALEIVRRLVAEAGGANDLPFRLSFDMASPSAILGGDAVDDIAISATAGPKAPFVGRLECSPPGRSHLIASGLVELGSAAGFKGRIDAEVSDAQPLRDWLTQDSDTLRASLSALGDVLPYRSVGLGGDFDISNAGFAARNLRLTVEQTSVNGTLAWTSAMGNERSRLFADLRSDELDLASLPNLSASYVFFRDSDVALSLEAKALHVEHVGETDLSGGTLSLKLSKTGDNLVLDRLAIAGLGGANVDAKGGANASGTWLEGHLDAAQLRDFAALARRLAPGAASDILVDRAPSLSPANMTFNAQFSTDAGNGQLAPISLTLAGSAGATHVEAKIGRGAADASALDAALSLNAPDAAPLLRQLGVSAQTLAGKGPGEFSLTAHGRMAEGLDAEAKATLAGVDLAWRGRVQPAGGDDARPLLSGAGGLKTANAGPLLSLLGFAAPDLALVIPAALEADTVWRNQALSFTHLRGNLGPSRLSGDLTWAAPPSEAAPSILDPDVALANALAGDPASERAAQMEGQLSIDRLPVAALTGLALGPNVAAKPGVQWSDAAFAPGLSRAVATDIKLAISRLDLSDALQAQDATGRIKIDSGTVKFADLSMSLRGGALTGHVDLRRGGTSAAASGQIGIDSVPIDAPGIAGRLSLSLNFAGSGQSASGLIGNLAGQGEIKLEGVKAPHLDPGALGRIVDKAEEPDYPIDQTNIEHALAMELDKQPLALPETSVPAFLSNGTLRISAVDVAGAKNRASLAASVDFKTLRGELHAAFSQTQTTKFWIGPPPAIGVDVKGPFGAPVRTIDAAGFAAGLAQQAIARESDRIATLEADMRERAAFNRRLKAEQFMRKREQELAAYALDQARLKSEQDRKRVEDATVKAADDARKAEEARKAAEEGRKADDARKAADDARKAEEARKAADEARRAEELSKAADEARKADEASKAADEARKADEAKKAASDASTAIAPPLPDEVLPPVFNAPAPPPRPRAPAAHAPDPTAGGLY
jgi:uncharacterized protein involved in outer membrane biogenesis